MQDDAELRARIEAQVAARRAQASSQPPDAADHESDAPPEPRPSGVVDPKTLSPTRAWPAREPVASDDVSGPEPAAATRLPADDAHGLEPVRPWIQRPSSAPGDGAGPAPSNPATVLSRLSDSLESRPAEPSADPSRAERLEERRRFAQRHAAADAALAAGVLPGDTVPKDGVAPGEPPVVPGAEPDTAVAAAVTGDPGLPDVDADAGDPAPEVEYPWLRKDEVDLDLKGAPTWDPADYPAEPEHESAHRAGRAFKWLFARAEPTASPAPIEARSESAVLSSIPGDEPESAPDPPPTPNGGWVAAGLVTNVGTEPEPAPEQLPEPQVPTAEPPRERRRGLGGRLRRPRTDVVDDEAIEPFTLPEPDAAFATPWTVTLQRPDPEPVADRAPLAMDDETEPLVPPPPPEPLRPPEPLQPPKPLQPPEPPRPPEPPEPPRATEPAEPAAAPRPRPRPHPTPTASTATDTPAPSTASWPPPLEPPAPLPPRLGIAGDAGATPDWLGGGISGVSFHKPGASSKAAASPDLSRFLAASEQRPGDERPVITDDEEPNRSWRNWRGWRFVVRTSIILAIAVVAALLLRTFVVAPYYIPSESMEPTLHGCTGCTDDHILVDKISYRTHDPKEGDIVVFNRPADWKVPDKVVVKRVIGLPGDKLSLQKGHVYVNGLLLDENYVKRGCGTEPLTNKSKWTVPNGDVFVMGDNRCNSDDSRMFGPIPQSDIIGRAFMIIWPLDRIRFL